MKFDKGLVPTNYGPWIAWFGVLVVGIVIFGFIVKAASGLTPAALALLGGPSPTPTPRQTALPTPTFTRGPLWTPTHTPSPSPTAPKVSPTATQPAPTRIPTATRFYVIPAQPTAIPTPILPETAAFPGECDGPGRMNILLIGIDGFNGNYNRSARADTLILVGVNFAQRSANMLSVPRDLWVSLPGLLQVPEGRINTAYHYAEYYGVPGGGPAELAAVFGNTFGLRVDRYVVVNFLAFEQGIDAIGGIDVNIPAPIHDAKYPLRDGSGTIAIDFPAGAVHMDGSTALIYARTRHDSSDFQRMRRQQQVLFAVRNRLLSPESLPHLPALAQVLLRAVRTNLSLDDLALLGCLGPQITGDAVQTWVIGDSQVQHTLLADGAQVLLPDMQAIQPILEQFSMGE